MTISALFAINLLLAAATVALAIYSFMQLRQLRELRKNLGPEYEPENLEEILDVVTVKIKNLEKGQIKADAAIAELTNKANFAVQKVGIVKFNALADEGGNLSTAIALLDETNSGVLITSIHGRSQTRVYAKNLKNEQSQTQLTEEEREAIRQAHIDWEKNINRPVAI